jgi:hypothetical protein
MAGKLPSFITGANAKIRAGGLVLAYAQDVNYTATIDVIPVETMGRYEVVSNEPVGYRVSGTLNVVRYTPVAQANGMAGAASGGNGLGNWNLQSPAAGTAGDSVNPGRLLSSQTWDLEVFQKKQDGTGAITSQPSVKVQDCRFTSLGGAITKRGILVESYSFVGILESDESFEASNSGDSDLST